MNPALHAALGTGGKRPNALPTAAALLLWHSVLVQRGTPRSGG
jgi:hypothetical protein